MKIFLPAQDDVSAANRIISFLNLIWSQVAWEVTLPVALVVLSAAKHYSRLTPFVLREIQIAGVSLTHAHTHTQEETDEGDEVSGK